MLGAVSGCTVWRPTSPICGRRWTGWSRREQTDATLRMTSALWHYWYRHGDLAEGRNRLERGTRRGAA